MIKSLLLIIAIATSIPCHAKIEISGYIMPVIQSGATNANEAYKTEIAINDVGVNIEGEINESTYALITFYADQEYLDNNNYSIIEEAFLTHSPTKNIDIKLGRSYLSLGALNTHFITSANTDRLASIISDIVEISYFHDAFGMKGYLYEAPAWENGDKDGLNSYGGELSYKNDLVDFRLGYISNVTAKISAFDGTTSSSLSGLINTAPGAYIGTAQLDYNGFSILGKYVTTTKAFNTSDDVYYSSKGKATKVKPTAIMFELAYTTKVNNKDLTGAMGIQNNIKIPDGNSDLLPYQIFLAGLDYKIEKNASLKIEHRISTDYKASKGGQTNGHTACNTTIGYKFSF